MSRCACAAIASLAPARLKRVPRERAERDVPSAQSADRSEKGAIVAVRLLRAKSLDISGSEQEAKSTHIQRSRSIHPLSLSLSLLFLFFFFFFFFYKPRRRRRRLFSFFFLSFLQLHLPVDNRRRFFVCVVDWFVVTLLLCVCVCYNGKMMS